MDREKLLTSLRLYEGFRGKPYLDTKGKTTIGYGRNLDSNPLTPEEGLALMMPQVEAAILNAPNLVSHAAWEEMGDTRQTVLAEMCYNMGFLGAFGFRRMRAALEQSDYKEAAAQILDSDMAGEVGNRAKVLATRMETGMFV